MSIENGRCPNCGGALILDTSIEIATCRYCGSEIPIPQAVQKCKIDGIADFDAVMLSAQEAMDFEKDFDKARERFRKALNLRPHDYRALWGTYLCEIEAIKWAKNYHGFVQVPGDISQKVREAAEKYGERALGYAPENVKRYYFETMSENSAIITDPTEKPAKKKGCYVATAVYGSYDCPEVWVLRRYRDFRLEKSIGGRLFIKVYYAVSPTIVRLFGNNRLFNKFWRKRLDKKVEKLKTKGYDDTPYEDLM